MRFSERYGYLKPSDVIIREKITPEIQNAICTVYDQLIFEFNDMRISNAYTLMEEYLWCYFLNNRKMDFYLNYGKHEVVATDFIINSLNKWHQKLDLIEETIKYLKNEYHMNGMHVDIIFKNKLNKEFERLNFGYRIIDGLITEITSEQEIQSIEKALEENKDNVRIHLNNALKALSIRPTGDYRNSIKESISAVEAFSREITGENNLNFKKMETKGLKIPSILQEAFKKLYGYTNHADTGIRHSLMDETAEYVPRADEALYMLITCSAFINYLNSKLKPENKQQ